MLMLYENVFYLHKQLFKLSWKSFFVTFKRHYI